MTFPHLCPGRSWKASSPAAFWATSSYRSPEMIQRSRGEQTRPAAPRPNGDTFSTTWSSMADRSPTSCSNRRAASMCVGKTDAEGRQQLSLLAVISAWKMFYSGKRVMFSMKRSNFCMLSPVVFLLVRQLLLADDFSPTRTDFFKSYTYRFHCE